MAENICIIDPLCDHRWDKFVEEHPLGWIFHLSGWKHILENSFNHIKGYYLVHFDSTSEKIQYALPLFIVKSHLLGNRLVSIPFATLCDPLVSDNCEYKRLLDAALNIYRKLKCRYIEIKSFVSTPILYDDRTTNLTNFQNHCIEINSSPKKLLKTFHRSCVRQKINRALKSDIEIIQGQDENDMRSFYDVYRKTRKRVARPVQPYRFFYEIWHTFHPSSLITLLLAKSHNQTIGAVILLKYKNRVSAEFAASDEKFLHLCPNHYLFWESIQLAYQEGYNAFDFGRTHISNKSLLDFKKRWGTKETNLSEFYYPKRMAMQVCHNETSWKLKLMSKMCKSSPPLINRAIGNFCYRHLG